MIICGKFRLLYSFPQDSLQLHSAKNRDINVVPRILWVHDFGKLNAVLFDQKVLSGLKNVYRNNPKAVLFIDQHFVGTLRCYTWNTSVMVNSAAIE